MNNKLQTVHDLIKNKKYYDSITFINKILNHSENFELISLKGFVYLQLKEFENAYDCYSAAIKIKKNSFECFHFRATTSFELGNFLESVKDFKNCLLINSQHFATYENIGKCYSNLGDNIKAIKYYELALKHSPNNQRLIEQISEKLSLTDIPFNKESSLSKINFEIKNLKYEYNLNKKIHDDHIIKIFNDAEFLIDQNFDKLVFNQTQIFRKNKSNINLNCDRHFLIFRNFKVIPKFCFSCIKVSIDLNNVMELLKLFLIFDNVSLPNNNLRKCMIDLRKNSKSNYKGLIYCQSVDEANIIKNYIDQLLKINISKDLSATIKRGCAAFNQKYPGYENPIIDSIAYNLEWKKYENVVDKKFPKFGSMKKSEESIKGIGLYETVIIKNWLFFAKLTNDNTYKKITQKNIDNQNLKKIIEHNKLNVDI